MQWWLHFTPAQCLLPKPIVTPLCMWGPVGDVITHAQFQLNWFRGLGATVTQIPYFLYITIMLYCDRPSDRVKIDRQDIFN